MILTGIQGTQKHSILEIRSHYVDSMPPPAVTDTLQTIKTLPEIIPKTGESNSRYDTG
jgi:hypothetical protein